jgi:hypothetical protein
LLKNVNNKSRRFLFRRVVSRVQTRRIRLTGSLVWFPGFQFRAVIGSCCANDGGEGTEGRERRDESYLLAALPFVARRTELTHRSANENARLPAGRIGNKLP